MSTDQEVPGSHSDSQAKHRAGNLKLLGGLTFLCWILAVYVSIGGTAMKYLESKGDHKASAPVTARAKTVQDIIALVARTDNTSGPRKEMVVGEYGSDILDNLLPPPGSVDPADDADQGKSGPSSTPSTVNRTEGEDALLSLELTDGQEQDVLEVQLSELLRQYEEDVRAAIDDGWKGGQFTLHKDEWSWQSAMLFCASVITTVGYGNIVPTTTHGRLFTIGYSLVGIPLTLVCMSLIGIIMARLFRWTIACTTSYVDPADGSVYVPLWLSLLVLFIYLVIGSIMFYVFTEGNWTYLESFYFCYITLTTIGLGDFVYGDDQQYTHGPEEGAMTIAEGKKTTNAIVSVLYIMVGLSLVSMCFSLMQEETARLIRAAILDMKKKANNLLKKLKCFS